VFIQGSMMPAREALVLSKRDRGRGRGACSLESAAEVLKQFGSDFEP
jgi:hypothetical protein